MPATTSSTHEGEVTVVAVTGDLANPGGAVTGDLANPGSADWRDQIEAYVREAPGAVVIDLAGLTGWGTHAQATLLHLLRHERANGRIISLRGLTGVVARQAHDSGMAGLLMTSAGDADNRPAWLTGAHSPALANTSRGTVPPTVAARSDHSRPAAKRAHGEAAGSGAD